MTWAQDGKGLESASNTEGKTTAAERHCAVNQDTLHSERSAAGAQIRHDCRFEKTFAKQLDLD